MFLEVSLAKLGVDLDLIILALLRLQMMDVVAFQVEVSEVQGDSIVLLGFYLPDANFVEWVEFGERWGCYNSLGRVEDASASI